MQNAKGDGGAIEAALSGVQGGDEHSHRGHDAQHGQEEYRAESRAKRDAEGLRGPGGEERRVPGKQSYAQIAVRIVRERGKNRPERRDEAEARDAEACPGIRGHHSRVRSSSTGKHQAQQLRTTDERVQGDLYGFGAESEDPRGTFAENEKSQGGGPGGSAE